MKKLIYILAFLLIAGSMTAQESWMTRANGWKQNNSKVTNNDTNYFAKPILFADDAVTSISDIAMLLTDTIPVINATIGQGNAGDTTLFSYGDIPWGIKWDGSFNLVITKVTAVVYGTTPDIDIALLHDTNFRDATPTAVLSADLTVTNTTTGADATSFASGTIAPGQWLYLRIDQCTAQPTQAIINIYGYLTR